ncbi:MAG: laccase domain-containing protein, partial [Magnetovibrio sp.]|nr:laccase domain-containing protein [Magnetovibrio sp.]
MFKINNLILRRVQHGFLSRKGGVSQGVYTSLNCAYGSNDAFENVAENRRRAVRRAGLNSAPLVRCSQIHSARVVTVVAPWAPDQAPEADALVTNIASIALGVLTADCVPVLFADVNAGVVGAAIIALEKKYG